MSQTFTDFVANAESLASADAGDLFAIVDISAGRTKSLTRTALKTSLALTKSDISLGNVENTALSTWAGSANITTLGTVTAGNISAILPSGIAVTGDPIDTTQLFGSAIPGSIGGTGVANSGKTITLGGNLTTSGAFACTLTVTASTNVTLPTTGTLATRAGAETLTNKTLTSPAITTPTGLVKGDVGLGNVDNTSNATERAASATLTNKTIGTGCVIPWEETIVLSAKGADAAAATNVAYFDLDYAVTLTAVSLSLDVAPAGSTFIVDINEAGTTVLSTKLSIDAGETTSATAASAAVISDANLASGARISFDIDQVGSGTAGQNAICRLRGTRTL